MFTSRPDARLFSLSLGQGPQAVLALGGWVGSGEVWLPLFEQLPHWRCVAMDHRGTGHTTQQGPISVQAMADDLLAVADAQALGRCVLAAESAGAGVALQAVLQAPERFCGLVLVGASWQRPAPGSQDGFIASLRHDHAAALRGFVAACLPEPGSEDWRRWGLQVLQRASLADAIELLTCRQSLALEPRLAGIKLPVLLLHGLLDVISPPEASRQLAKALPVAQLHLLPGLGHVPIITAAPAMSRLIDNWATAQMLQPARTTAWAWP